MKILHTVEFYSPSMGGAQEVVKQISERLVQLGHEVTVATTKLPERKNKEINGVHIEEFDIAGNTVRGLTGETERYQNFLKHGDFDLMMNYAAQQWATDLVYPILDQIPYKKVLIPCGFSGLFMPEYTEYFKMLPAILEKYDHLAFHADDYRDTNFARQHGIENWSFIPNGASSEEFSVVDPTFRTRYGIPSDAIMLLTVGSHTGSKGHALVLDALKKISVHGKVVLVIIGNVPNPLSKWESIKLQLDTWRANLLPLFQLLLKKEFKIFSFRVVDLVRPLFWGGLYVSGCIQDCRMRANRINLLGDKGRRVLLLNPPRADVVAAYHASDLFVFGSNIEYSPLVLFEAMSSKTPFLTLACGNAAEIVEWTGGGVIAPTIQRNFGVVDGDSQEMAACIDSLLSDPERCAELAENGYRAWRKKFTWDAIAQNYEKLYKTLITRK